MFSLHGLAGLDFRGTLEQLAVLPGVTASRRVRAIAHEGEEASPNYITRLDRHPAGGHAGYDGAIENYRDMLNLDQEGDPLCHAYQIMAREVFTLGPDATAAGAWRTLLGQGIRQTPVLDAGRHVIGLVTERDLLITFTLERKQPRAPLAHHVRDVMLSPVICADPVTDIRRIARAMLEFDLPCVPVVNESRTLLGLVSRGDILRAVIADPPLSLWV